MRTTWTPRGLLVVDGLQAYRLTHKGQWHHVPNHTEPWHYTHVANKAVPRPFVDAVAHYRREIWRGHYRESDE